MSEWCVCDDCGVYVESVTTYLVPGGGGGGGGSQGRVALNANRDNNVVIRSRACSQLHADGGLIFKSYRMDFVLKFQ